MQLCLRMDLAGRCWENHRMCPALKVVWIKSNVFFLWIMWNVKYEEYNGES